MRINDNHIAGMVRNQSIKRQLIETQQKYAKTEMGFGNEVDQNIEKTFKSILESDVKSYLIKKTALDVIDRIKINGSFDPKVFTKIPVQKAEIVLNETQLYRYWYNGDKLRGIFIQKVNTDLGPSMQYESFSITPDTGGKSHNLYTDVQVSDRANRLFKILIFLYFSDIQTTFLKPNGKLGSLTTERFKNDLKSSFIVVDTTWNKILIRTEGFSVSGHFRLQPWGKNNEDRKLIFIEEYEKNGYVRGAKKESLES